jgi:transcriptional regulator with XRE-family HTH domain
MGIVKNVARNLHDLRLKRKLSQQVLAKKAGFSVSYISMLERGQRIPPLETLEVMARVLRVDPVHLLQ